MIQLMNNNRRSIKCSPKVYLLPATILGDAQERTLRIFCMAPPILNN